MTKEEIESKIIDLIKLWWLFDLRKESSFIENMCRRSKSDSVVMDSLTNLANKF